MKMLFLIMASTDSDAEWDHMEDESVAQVRFTERIEDTLSKEVQLVWLNAHFKAVLPFLDMRGILDREESIKIVSYIHKILYNIQHHIFNVLSQPQVIAQWDSMRSKHEFDLRKLGEYIADAKRPLGERVCSKKAQWESSFDTIARSDVLSADPRLAGRLQKLRERVASFNPPTISALLIEQRSIQDALRQLRKDCGL